MSMSKHVVFNVVLEFINLVLLIFDIHGQKMQFSASGQFSLAERSVFELIESIHFFRNVSLSKNLPL